MESLRYGGVKLGYNASGISACDTTSTITGHVYVIPGNLPVVNATVCADASISAETAADGSFTLAGVPSTCNSFTAVYTHSVLGGNYQLAYRKGSSDSMPSSVDFYVIYSSPEVTETISFTATVTDESGNPVSGAAMSIGAGLFSGSTNASTDASGIVTFSSFLVFTPDCDSLFVIMGKAGLGGAYLSGLSGSHSSPVNVNLSIRQPATASGTASSAYAYSSYSISSSPSGNITPFTGLTTTCAIDGSYTNLLVPTANAGDSILLNCTGTAVVGEKHIVGHKFASVSPTAGSTFTQNFVLPEPPGTISVSTAESGGVTWITATWEASPSWDVNTCIYIFVYKYGFVYTNQTTITLPCWSGTDPVPENYVEVMLVKLSRPDVSDIIDGTVTEYANNEY